MSSSQADWQEMEKEYTYGRCACRAVYTVIRKQGAAIQIKCTCGRTMTEINGKWTIERAKK